MGRTQERLGLRAGGIPPLAKDQGFPAARFMIVGQPRKMTDAQVRELCQRWDSGEWTVVELQEQYGITAPTLYRYIRRQSPRAAALAPLTGPTAGAPDGRHRIEPVDRGADTPAPSPLVGTPRRRRDRATHGHGSHAPSYRLVPVAQEGQ